MRAQLREVSDRAAADLLLRALGERGGEATGADLEVATGLGHDKVERTMSDLLDRYESRLAVAKGGALVYRFDSSSRRGFKLRPERRAALHAFLAAVAAVTRTVTTSARVAFQVVLAVQLLVYTFVATLPIAVVVGAVAGVAMLVCAIFTDKDGIDFAFTVLMNPYIGLIVLTLFVLGGIGWVISKEYEVVMDVFSGRRDGKVPKRGQALVAVVSCVNDFAVGPATSRAPDERTDRTMRISLADERLVLARVRAAGGRLRSGDLVRWLGLDLDEADRQSTRLAVEHDGTPETTNLEVIEFQFPRLLEGSAGHDPKGKTLFERGETAPAHTGNEAMQDVLIAGFALVNLGAGYLGLRAFAGHDTHRFLWGLAAFFGGTLPIYFALFLLGFWVARWPLTALRAHLARRRAARGELLRRIVAHCAEHGGKPLDLGKLEEERPLVHSLGGSADVAEDADPPREVWRFDRLVAELEPVREKPAQLKKAEVVYET
jgi:hypothetical protein